MQAVKFSGFVVKIPESLFTIGDSLSEGDFRG